ncbi:MAG: multicopper oxidase family protein [Pyrobaculum sp.]
MGQAGLVIIEDKSPFKYGINDVPLVISDKFLLEGRPAYAATHMDMVTGFLGDTVLVNGAVMPTFSMPQGTYKLRLVNASNARLYNLALEGPRGLTPLKVVATDQGAVERIVEAKAIFLAPAERVEVVVDLRPGTYVLKNLAFDPMHLEMGGMPMGGMPHGGMRPILGEGAEYKIAVIKVSGEKGEFIEPELSEPPPPAGVDTRRRFVLALRGMRWTINGMFWTNPLRPHVAAGAGSVEVWEITNDVNSMPHPMHLHGLPMWVLERRNSPPQVG